MAHTKRMHSGTWKKETDQRRQTRENIWPHTNGCTVERGRRRLTSGDRLEKIYGRTPMEMYPLETYSGKRKPCQHGTHEKDAQWNVEEGD
ncbi:hypothetical protein M513_04341 [Trichuris suis]|uniref:Uncharacterized protein n=1 Tax=Trichuris suis TaxID=68888 RepID=A0A085MBP5_9BILA|nr:hypothetical protein M513_04341 [Trichuris suis]